MNTGLQATQLQKYPTKQKQDRSFKETIDRAAITKLASLKDNVSFTSEDSQPIIDKGGIFGDVLVVPKDFTSEKPLNTEAAIEIKNGASLKKVTCVDKATVKGSVDRLSLRIKPGYASQLNITRNAKIRELVIEKDINPLAFQIHKYYRNSILDAEKLTNYCIFTNISNKALKDPENFKRVVINGKEISREEFVKLTSKTDQDKDVNGFLLITPDSFITTLKDILGSTNIRNTSDMLLKPEALKLLEDETPDDYYKIKLELEAKFRKGEPLEPFQEEILARKLRRNSN